MVSLPSEGEEEDEFMFSRLKKQIKSHWNKIKESYPNSSMLFRTPTLKESTESEIEEVQPETTTLRANRSESIKSSLSSSTAASSLTSNSSIVNVEQHLISSALKSAFLLPIFSCKRDDEGRRGVPFISSLLQVVTLICLYLTINATFIALGICCKGNCRRNG